MEGMRWRTVVGVGGGVFEEKAMRWSVGENE